MNAASPLAVLVLVGLGTLLAAFALRGSLAPWIGRVAGVLMVLLAALGLSAVLAPRPYEALAERALGGLGVLREAEALDADLASAVRVPEGLADAARDLLGLALPRPADEPGDGPFARGLARILVPILAAILRGAALVVSLAGMVAVLALGFAGRAAEDLRSLRAAHTALEARLEALEAAAARRPD